MTRTVRVILIGLCVGLMAITLVAQQMPTTKKEVTAGAASVKTEEISGTVLLAEGGQVVMRMSTGEIKTFNPPASRTAMVDGKEVTAAQLKPGTKLKATITTTTTPVTERTTTVGTGKVWFVSGNTVILTLPNNENRMYKVANSYKFIIDGKPTGVHDLRKGMTVSAEKIVEEPRTEIASNTTITGSAPPPPRAAAAPAPAAVDTPAPAPRPRRAEPAPAPAPAETAAAPAPAKLPKTASPFPMVGLLGFLCTGASFGLRKLRRFQ